MRLHAILFLCAFLASANFIFAQTQASLSVEGEVNKPAKFQLQDIAVMKHVTVQAADRDGKQHSYSGVPLYEILQAAGVTMNEQLKGENMAKYLLVKSGDGYEVVFSLPELDSSFSNNIVILADKMDGNDLPQGKGPWRIVVPAEKKHARWIWDVRTLAVRFAKD
jgi:DMSO/TMAO reductase YedYZ molybdopterin-dependent catalytic subunit